MDVDDQAAEDPHSNGSKRKYESSSEDEFEDPEYLDQSFDLLSNSVPVKIQEDFVVIKEKSVDVDRESKFYCKLLKFSIDWSLEEVLSIIEYLDREEFSNLFIFIIETENTGIKITENSSKRIKLSSELDQVKEKLLEFAQERPLILQITSLEENEVKFFYKDENGSKILQEIENIKESMQKPNSFPSFLKAFFDGTIQSLIKLFEESPKKYENSLLIWRFLRTLDMPDTSWNKLMLKCAECGTKNELFAAIDDPFERDEWMVRRNAQQWFTGTIPEEPKEPDQHDVIESPQDEEMEIDGEVNNVNQGKDSTKASSLLHAAVENSNTEIIEYLIFSWSCFIQELPNDHKIIISTAAYTKSQFKILCDLINKFDFPFPQDFNVDQCNHEELQSIANQRIDFHKAIKKKNFEQITEFITNNRSLKVVFNPVNLSAMKYAINLKKYGTYFYLESFGLKASEFTDLEKVLSEEQMKKATIFKIKQRRQNVEKGIISKHESVNLLCNRSRIHDMKMGNDQECHKQIRKWFEEIHDVKYCSTLLKVASSCEDLKIIFDFESTSVENSSLSNSRASGVTYTTLKWIFIGAKSINNEREQKIKGVLAHELCHYVMRLVYENEDNPYYKYKEDIKKIFDEISNEINVWQTKEPNDPDDECNGVISSVYQLYTKEEFHLELIVRVVQILVEFGDNEDKITELEEKYKKLFDFWEQYVMPDLESFNLKSREFVRKMNRICKLLDYLKGKELEFSIEKDMQSVMNEKAMIVTSNVPKLLLVNIFRYQQSLLGNIFDTKTVFIDSDILNNQENWSDCKKMMKEIPELKIVIDCSEGNCDEFKDLKIHPDSSLIFVVQDDKQAENFKQYIPKRNNTVTNKVMDYDINDLTTESQENLLKSKINFQGNSNVSLHDLIVNKKPFHVAKELNLSKIIDVHLFNLLLGNKNVKINNVAEDPLDFRLLFQPRQLLQPWDSYSVKEFLSKIKNEKYVLISDIAGNGKSWVTRNVSEIVRDLDPTKWVTYIDLKQFINVLKGEKDKIIKFSSFFIEKILKLENNFEKEIFMRMYEIGKVFIIFDGFDEIAPNYAEFVCELAKLFEQNEGNQMLIATRNYFEVDLTEELKIHYSFRLNHFSKENGAEFITKSWILSEMDTKIVHTKVLFEENINNSQKFNKYLEFAQKLIEKVSMSGRSIGMPQIYKIIAEISKDDKEATINLSLTEIYRTLIQNLFQRWATEKGEIRKKANAESLEYEMNFYRFHQFLAIWSLFHEYIGVFFVGYDPKEWKNSEIIACGIVALVDYEDEDDHHFQLENGEGIYRFTHETFREYFVADFITKELNKSSPHQEALKMFAELMTVEKYGIIRMFLNEKLESSVLHKIMPKMKVIPKFDKMFQDMNSFADIFERGLNNLIEFIILFLKTRNEGIISKILFNAALTFSQNPPQFLKFQEFLMKHCNNNFLIKLVKEEGIFLQLLRSNVEFEQFEEFFLNMKSKIGSEIVKEGLKMKRIKVKNKYIDHFEDVDEKHYFRHYLHHFLDHYLHLEVNIFSLLCKTDLDLSKLENLLHFLDRHFSAKQTLEILLRCDENETTLLQKVFKSYTNPLEYWIKIKKYFNTEETLLKELISKFDLEGNNILHCTFYISFDNFKHFLGEIFNIIDKDSVKNLLTRVNRRGYNFLHKIMIYYKSEIDENKIEYIISILDKYFDKAQIAELIKSKNCFDQSLFQMVLERNLKNCQIYKTLWVILKENCINEEFFEIIHKSLSWESENIVKIVAKNDSTSKVLEFLIDDLATFPVCYKTQVFLWNLKLNDHLFLSNLAAKRENFELFEKLFRIYNKCFNSHGFDKIFDGLLFEIVQTGNVNLVEFAWQVIKSFKGQNNDQIGLYLRRENWKYNLIENSSQNVAEWLKKILHDYNIEFEMEIFSEFSLKFDECMNSGSHKQLENLLNHYELFFQSKNLLGNFKHFLMTPDKNKRNFLHRATFCENIEFNKVLWKRILNVNELSKKESIESSTIHEILQIFNEVDRDGNTILQTVVEKSTNVFFLFLISILESTESFDLVKEILNDSNKNCKLFYLANKFDLTLELHETLWDVFNKYFESNLIIDLFSKCKFNKGVDPLQIAVACNKKEIVDLTWNNFRSSMSQEDQDKYLNENFNIFKDTFDEKDEHKVIIKNWIERNLIQKFTILRNFFSPKTQDHEVKDHENHSIKEDLVDDKNIIVINDNNEEESNSNFIRELLLYLCKKRNIFYDLINSSSSDSVDALNAIKTVEYYLRPIEVFYLMKNCNEKCENIFHVLNRIGNGKKLINWVEAVGKFSSKYNIQKEFEELFFGSDLYNRHFLNCSILNMSFEFHETIWNYLKVFLTGKLILNICVRKIDILRNNFVHSLLEHCKNAHIIEYIFNIFTTKLNQDEYKELISCLGNYGENLLQTALVNKNSIKIFPAIWEIFLEFYKSDIVNVLLEKDSLERNALSVAVCHSSAETFTFFTKNIESILKTESDREKIFNFENARSMLFLAVGSNKELALHEVLWNRICQFCSKNVIKSIIQSVNQYKDNILHSAAHFNSQAVIEFTWNKIKIFLNEDEQIKYLNKEGFQKERIEDICKRKNLTIIFKTNYTEIDF